MEVYERNYMLVRLLAPDLREMTEGEHVSSAPGAMPLVLDRIAHDRYTTTFNLTYRFSSRHRHAREPDLSIRLYHDARTCEVMSGLLPGERLSPRRTRDLDEGWRLNRFLHRWLGYCLRQGHGFGTGDGETESRERSRETSGERAGGESSSPCGAGSDEAVESDVGADASAGNAPVQRQ